MKMYWCVVGVMCLFLAGCASIGSFPQGTGTQVDLSKNNYRIVKTNAIGESSGFYLLGFIPFGSPRYAEAMSNMYKDSGVKEGGATALTNVTQEKSFNYYILFGVPKLTIRADIVEFTAEDKK